MADKSIEALTADQLAAYKESMGPFPVLRTEDAKHYEVIFDAAAKCLKATDVVMLILVAEYVEATWMIRRYSRHATFAIERWHRQSAEYQARQSKAKRVQKEALAGIMADQASQTPADIAHMQALERNVKDLASDTDAIFDYQAAELEHNAAIEKSGLFLEQLDRLVTSAVKRRNGALNQLELYRMGLGEQMSRSTDNAIEGECHELTALEGAQAPSFVPALEPNGHDVEPQDSGQSA